MILEILNSNLFVRSHAGHPNGNIWAGMINMTEFSKFKCDTFLRFLTNEDRETLMKNSINREFTKGELIVRVMDRDTNLYLINSGRVRVSLYSNDGKEVSFVDISAGGEILASFQPLMANPGQPM